MITGKLVVVEAVEPILYCWDHEKEKKTILSLEKYLHHRPLQLTTTDIIFTDLPTQGFLAPKPCSTFA